MECTIYSKEVPQTTRWKLRVPPVVKFIMVWKMSCMSIPKSPSSLDVSSVIYRRTKFLLKGLTV